MSRTGYAQIGDLRMYHEIDGEGRPLLLLHGAYMTVDMLGPLRAGLAQRYQVIAPELQGHGRTNDVDRPISYQQHADDCAALLDHVGAETAVVTGHSMGGFVATALATRHPERVRAVVLVDGGPPLHVPAGVDVDDALAATLGPAMQRLDMTFADRGAYRAFWQQHPSFAGIWSAEIDAHVQHDLIGEEPEMRSSCVKEAVRVNGRELLADEGVRLAIRDVSCPLVMLWAPRGMVDDPPGLYVEERLNGLEHECVTDTNHYSILLGAPGAKRVAAAIRRAL